MFSKNIIYEDTTLRDGEQAPGIAFDKETKIKIFKMLYSAGVRWFEVGIPAMGGDELSALQEILKIKNDAIVLAWCRGIKEEVEQALDLGFKAVHVGLPVSDIHINNSLDKDRKWLIDTAVEIVKLVKNRGAFLSISAEDVGRADIDFLLEYAKAVSYAGADRLRLSDTVGILDFNRYGEIVKKVKENIDIEVQCHTHNDFGLAIANTLSGLINGAKYFHATINGIGERAGMPDILPVYMALKKMYNIDLNLDIKKLLKCSDYLKEITGTKCLPWSPLIGENIFLHESGIHVNGMVNNSKTFEAIQAYELGKESHFILGKHSGKSTIKYLLKKNKINYSKDQLPKALEFVKRQSVINKGEVSIEELKNYIIK